VKIVIDTSVIVAYAVGNIKTKKIFELIISKKFKWYVSNEILNEYRYLLDSKKLNLNDSIKNDCINLIMNYTINVEIKENVKFSQDPNDQVFLSLCKAINADYLITEDKKLLNSNHRVLTKILNISNFYNLY